MTRTCEIKDCSKKQHAKGLCRLHYNTVRETDNRCTIVGCGKIYHAKGLCANHYSQSPQQAARRRLLRTGTSLSSWKAMVGRCNNINDPSYHNYGGRGIRVCDRWLGDDGFANFIKDIGERPSADYSIDRLDVNDNYCPENCRWASHTQQMINRRMFKNNKSGYTGVYITKNKKYLAILKMNNKVMLCKQFKSIDEAIAARKNAERTYFKPLMVV